MSNSVFILKVTLASQKSIWRKIAICGNQTLEDLHQAIYDAFDRDDEHLHSFYLPPPGKKTMTKTTKTMSRETFSFCLPV
jgi:hypothetical protein